jgi:hypothetical protein
MGTLLIVVAPWSTIASERRLLNFFLTKNFFFCKFPVLELEFLLGIIRYFGAQA